MRPDSRHQYHRLLRSSLSTRDFFVYVAHILDADPYFFPARLEMIWRAEELEDQHMRTMLIGEGVQYALKLFTDARLRRKIEDTWTDLEITYLQNFLEIATVETSGFLKKRAYWLINMLSNFFFNTKTIQSSFEPRHLILMGTYDVSPIQKELAQLGTYWWLIDTARQKQIAHHKHTHMIVLRQLLKQEETSIARDAATMQRAVALWERYTEQEGVHESVTGTAASVLPETHSLVIRLAKELGIGLGRVVVVQAAPHTQIYRHYDSEPWLTGRKRFHLVVQVGTENILSAGDETVNAQPGELWFFDNKVMHRAENKSSVPRIHIIFDGYPLAEEEEE